MSKVRGSSGRYWWIAFALCMALTGCANEGDSPSDQTGDRASEAAEGAGAGSGGYAIIDPALQPFRKDFEAGYGRVRLIAIIAPTCGSCLQNARAILDEVLPNLPEGSIDTYFVWSSVLVTDVEPRAVRRVRELDGPGVQHYWDETGRVARAFGRLLQYEGKAYDCFFIYGPDAIWDAENTMSSEPADFNALLDGWFPLLPDASYTKHREIKLPGFTSEAVLQSIRSLM